MIVIVGLGNPGKKYEHSRHNVGFDIIEVLSQKYHIPLDRKKCKAEVGEGIIEGQRVVLCRPQTFMNLSGESVVPLLQWYKPEYDQVLICLDDIDLPEGKIRMRPRGSAGTHNGLRNIVYLLGRDDFPRLRVGIGRPPAYMDLKDFVTMGYETAEKRQRMFTAFMTAADAVGVWVRDGIVKATEYIGAHQQEGV